MRTTVILTAIATLSIGAAASAADIDPESQKAIDATRAFHSALDSMHVQYQTKTKISVMGQNQDQTATISVHAERPNRLSFATKQDMMGELRITSDGNELLAYVDAPTMGLSAYTLESAPPDFEKLTDSFSDLMFMSTGPVSADASSLALMLFLTPDNKELFSDLDSATYVGTEQYEGVDAHKIDMVLSSEIEGETITVPATVWIQQGDTPWILGVKPDLAEIMKVFADQGGMPPGITFDVTQTLLASNTHPTFDADTFAITPPANAKKVDSLIDVLMGPPPEPENAPHSASAPGGPESLVGNPAPAFSLDLLSGGTVDLTQHKGKDIVVLDFWATWCGPCVKAMPTLIEVTDKFKDQNVVFYAVNLREDPAKINKFLEKKGFDTNVLLDKAGNTAMAYQARGIPQTVIIDKKGNVQAVHVGLAPNLKAQLTDELQKIIGGNNLY